MYVHVRWWYVLLFVNSEEEENHKSEEKESPESRDLNEASALFTGPTILGFAMTYWKTRASNKVEINR